MVVWLVRLLSRPKSYHRLVHMLTELRRADSNEKSTQIGS